jgi:hypothetical protein
MTASRQGRRSPPSNARAELRRAVLEAGRRWLDAEEDDEYEEAEAAFTEAAGTWLLDCGWTPPEGEK